MFPVEKLEIIQKTKEIVIESNDKPILKKILNTLISILQLTRIHQWPKNLFVFSGIFISFNIFDFNKLINSIFAFLLFCGISSSVYIMNDISDMERDKLHPVKRMRPLPAGKIKIYYVLVFEVLLLVSTFFLSFMLNKYFGEIVVVYFILNLFYSLKLKEFVFIDIIIISTGFVLRAISGILVTGVKNSFWLLLSIAFLTLFLGINKRKREIIELKQGCEKHRKNLNDYSVNLINQIIPMLTSCTIISYSLYIIYEIANKFLIITIPIVLYGILRYQYLTDRKNYGENPELVLFRDKPTILAILLWCLIFVSSKVLLGTLAFQ
jgi:4-hydroxybenzoate polyprenyltransferase